MAESQTVANDINDLTQGPIIKKLMLFFLPIAAGTLFQQLYNAVDAFVVSTFVGKEALAAVGGSPTILINLIIGFCTALAAGCAVVIAQLYGAGARAAVTSAVKTSFIFCSLIGMVIGAVVVVFSPQMLTWLKTPEDTFDGALLYQRIFFAGSLFLMVFNMGAGILRAVGNSRFPFLCLCVSCGVNIVLDVLFVAVFNMGVAGVAVATVIAEIVSAFMVTAALLKTKEEYRLTFRTAFFSWEQLRQMLKIGIPSGLQNSMYGISNMILQIAINELGTTVVAAWAMSSKIDGFYWAVTSAFGMALTTFIGQNYGAKNISRMHEATKKSSLLHLCITIGISAILLLSGRTVLAFITDDIGVIENTWIVMYYVVPSYVLWSIIEVYSATLRGIGDTVVPSVILAVGICASRIIWIYTVFVGDSTLQNVCLCYPLSWFLTDLAILPYYLYRRKKLNQKLLIS